MKAPSDPPLGCPLPDGITPERLLLLVISSRLHFRTHVAWWSPTADRYHTLCGRTTTGLHVHKVGTKIAGASYVCSRCEPYATMVPIT